MTESEGSFASHLSDKGLVPGRVLKREKNLLQLNLKLNKKRSEQTFSKGNLQTTNMHNGKILDSISCKGNKNQNYMRHHFKLTRMVVIKDTIPSAGEDVEKLGPSHTAGGRVQPLCKTIRAPLKKSHIELLRDQPFHFLGVYVRDLNTPPHKNVYRNIHGTVAHKSQKRRNNPHVHQLMEG